MIRSFRDKETEKVFNREVSKKIPLEIQDRAKIKLDYLHQAESVTDLINPPGNRLEKLQGDLKERWSIRINQQWRILFLWENDGASEVEIADYH